MMLPPPIPAKADANPLPSRMSYDEVLLASGQAESSMGESGDPVVMNSGFDMDKRPQQAFIRSIALPGWGQRWSNRPVQGAFFTAVDVLLWGGVVLSWESHLSNTKHYESFAVEHAGVIGDHNLEYYVDIANFPDVDSFNEFRRTQGDYINQYTENSDYWFWDSEDNRSTFKDLRTQAGKDRNRVFLLIGGVAINRIVSGIEAARGLAAQKSKFLSNTSLHIQDDPSNGATLVGIAYRR